MPINTILHIAFLAIRARNQPCHELERFHFLVGDLMFMLEATFVAVSAVAAEVMVVAEFVGGGTRFDFGHGGAVDADRGVETAGSGCPGWEGGGFG